ncbi:hypothetical protein Cgig2_010554 [Carnegiea gigantea]|uniref:DUF4378 domain-containing protein n=1 Tax=Carnegiea gigantea TaxID=171969 RepID=A0A9Q1KU34_9CARY|nr:hypothetical protein Cgig2_010554 [Carnegiea gigantea]
MGREWYFNWGSNSSSSSKKAARSAGGGSSGGCEGVKTSAAPPAAAATVAVAAAAVGGGGCMNALLSLFDFHHFQLCSKPHDSNPTISFSAQDPTSLKGVEAPRKSLEVLSEEAKRTIRRDTKLKVAIQAPRDHQKQDDSSSEGARTPNLVARLMGLDILPESPHPTTPRTSHSQSVQSSPHITSSSTPPRIRTSSRKTRPRSSYNNDVPGPKSLPETPRSSSSSKYTSHVLERHRLSLEFDKENSLVREMESSRPSCSAISTKRRDLGRSNLEEESRSPRYYARQIMKQVKETVSRRRRSVGADITNTVNNNGHRRDENLLSISSTKTKKSPNKKYSSNSSPGNKHSTNSPSPRFKSIQPNAKFSLNSENQPLALEYAESEHVHLMAPKLQSKPIEDNKNDKQELKKLRSTKSCSKKHHPKSLSPIRKTKEEQFIHPPIRANDKKSKKTPLSSDLLHGSVHSLVSVKKVYHPASPPRTKLPQKQEAPPKGQALKLMTSSSNEELSRSPSQWRYKKEQEEATHASAEQARGRRGKATITSAAEFQYISRILKCTGIDRDTPVSLTTWFAPTHPLGPTIFHNLETTHYAPTTSDDTSPTDDQLRLSFDKRRLIFHLVDEILADILTPLIRFEPWVSKSARRNYRHHQLQHQINGFELVNMLCKMIQSLPCTDCETLQDIDSLVEKDLPKFESQSNLIAFEEDGEAIVSEIEHDIVDSLIQEVAVFLLG